MARKKSKTSKTLLRQTKQYTQDDGEGCERSGQCGDAFRDTWEITQKQDFCESPTLLPSQATQGKWEELWQSPGAPQKMQAREKPYQHKELGDSSSQSRAGSPCTGEALSVQ